MEKETKGYEVFTSEMPREITEYEPADKYKYKPIPKSQRRKND